MDAFLPPGSPMHRTVGDLEYAGVSSVTIPVETPPTSSRPTAPSLRVEPMSPIAEELAQTERDDPLNQAFFGSIYPDVSPISSLPITMPPVTPGIIAPLPGTPDTPRDATSKTAAASSRVLQSKGMDFLKITK